MTARSEEQARWLGVLWGKSDKGNGANLLVQHLLDTAAVGEQLWDHYLAANVRSRLDRVAGGDGLGRRLFSFLCGVHDVGKATPAFQSQHAALAQAVWDAGLGVDGLGPRAASTWRHDVAGGKALFDLLRESGWSPTHVGWVWPIIAGHHGVYPEKGRLKATAALGVLHGNDARWGRAREWLLGEVTTAVGAAGLDDLEPKLVPTRAEQLALTGLVIMADWIASRDDLFHGIFDVRQVTMADSRHRAGAAWASLALDGGWRTLAPGPASSLVKQRFGYSPRPSQTMVVDAVAAMPTSGLVIVEAPTGEGKTEAALAAAELLAARTGASGLFIGMPTQATADPMFGRVVKWVEQVSPGRQLALLHGRRRFSREWKQLRPPSPGAEDVDEYGQPLEYGSLEPRGIEEDGEDPAAESKAAADWFLGNKRGLLTPVVVGTIDQLLFAATRTKHVMVRYAGLAGKVVVLDEVHAADVYMHEFIDEALWWLGQGRVPVVLLSATISPRQRQRLVDSYLQGATGEVRLTVDLASAGYPGVTTCWAVDEEPEVAVAGADPWRAPQRVTLQLHDEDESDPAGGLSAWLKAELRDGGCVLVIRNTVRRAQEAYLRLREWLTGDVVLLHGRMTAGHRAQRTEALLDRLGPNALSRPTRLVVVATQVAEQSFDIDADLLITDLAPVDLMIQRIGRLHRHAHGAGSRPAPLREPRVVVTGMRQTDQVPVIDPGSDSVYPPYILLRTAANVLVAAEEGWILPTDAPALVAEVYGDTRIAPAGWDHALQQASDRQVFKDRRRMNAAQAYRLVAHGERSSSTLAGLHRLGTSRGLAEEQMRAVVRDGDQTIEVVLLRRSDRGITTIDGTPLGQHGENAASHLDEVLAGAVRLPPTLTSAALDLTCLPEWRGRPWLQFQLALILDSDGTAVLGDRSVRYDEELGLQVGADATRERL